MAMHEYEVPMVTMGIFIFKEKFPWQNRESNLGPHDQ
jgi:hypothetical protein